MSVKVSLPEFDAWRAGYRSAGEAPESPETPEIQSVKAYMERARPILANAPSRRSAAVYPKLDEQGGFYDARPVIDEATRRYNGLELTLSSLAHDPTAEARGQWPHHLPADHSPVTADRFAVYAGGRHEDGKLVFVVDNTRHFGGPVILDHEGNEVQDDPAFNDLVDRTLAFFESDPTAATELEEQHES